MSKYEKTNERKIIHPTLGYHNPIRPDDMCPKISSIGISLESVLVSTKEDGVKKACKFMLEELQELHIRCEKWEKLARDLYSGDVK